MTFWNVSDKNKIIFNFLIYVFLFMHAKQSKDTDEYYKFTLGGEKKCLWLRVGMRKDLGWMGVELFSGWDSSLTPCRTFAIRTDADEGENKKESDYSRASYEKPVPCHPDKPSHQRVETGLVPR